MGVLGGLSEAEARIAELEAELALAAPVLAAARALVAGCPVGDPLPLAVSPLVYDLHRAVGALDTTNRSAREPTG